MRNVWSQRDADLADALLGFVQARRSEKLTDADVPGAYAARVLTTEQQRANSDDDAVTRVWQRLLTQRPHMFAVARARGTLKTFTPERQDAAFASAEEPACTKLFYQVGASTA